MPGAPTGPLALVGGAELQPGNEEHDRLLAGVVGAGRAFVLATAAARHRPDLAVRHAADWFATLGVRIEELPAVRASDVRSQANATLAREGRLFYLVGGDPGRVPATLAGSVVWAAVVDAWRRGAALAGSSAGAMALGEWTLTRDHLPGDANRRYRAALGLVPRVAVIPHLDTFGASWVEPSLEAAPHRDVVLVGLDERTATVWTEGAWRAAGPGRVVVITSNGSSTFRSGDAVDGIPAPGSGFD